MNKILSTLILLALSLSASETKVLDNLILEDKNGGMVLDNSAWNAHIFKGKTTLLMYVDPDEQPKGEIFKSTIVDLSANYPEDQFQIVVILNLDATWKPNALIQKLVKGKIEEFPRRSFVLDKKSILVNTWNLPTDEYNVLLLNHNAEVIVHHAGKWDTKQIEEFKTAATKQLKESL